MNESLRHVFPALYAPLLREVFDRPAIGGRDLLAAAISRYDLVASPKLAKRLALTRKMRVLPSAGGVALTTYSRHDPVFLTQLVYDVLKEFDLDATVADAIARLRRERGVEVPEALLLEMQQFGVMDPSPAGEDGPSGIGGS